MDETTILVGLSQLAIALTGFTTVATVVTNLGESTNPKLLAGRLSTTLYSSVLLIFSSLLPILFWGFGFQSPQTYQYSAIAMAVLSILPTYLAIRITLVVWPDAQNPAWQTIGSWIFGGASYAALFAAIFLQNAPFFYVFALVCLLAAAMTTVIGTILSFPVFDTLGLGRSSRIVKPDSE